MLREPPASSSPCLYARRPKLNISARRSTARGARWRTASRECQLGLFTDRTSAATMRANQLRLWFASMAYMLDCGTSPDRAQPHPIRPSHLRDDPPQAPQNQCSRHHQCPADQGRHGIRAHLRSRVRARPRFPGHRRALTNQTAHSRYRVARTQNRVTIRRVQNQTTPTKHCRSNSNTPSTAPDNAPQTSAENSGIGMP